MKGDEIMSLNIMRTDHNSEELLSQDEEHSFLLSLTAEDRTKDSNGEKMDDSIGEFLLLDDEDTSRGVIVTRFSMPDKMINAGVRVGLMTLRDHLGQTDKDTLIISRKQFHNTKCEAEFIATCKEIFYNMDGMHLVITETHTM
jgi:hypothetical protein